MSVHRQSLARRRLSIAALSASAMLAVLPGCGVFGGSDKDDKGRTTERLDSRIPSDARVVDEGDRALSYTATDDGTIYVEDARDRKTIVERRVSRGHRVRVEFDDDRILINDDKVYTGNLERDHTHRIYFLRSGDRTIDRDRSRDDRDRTRDDRGGRGVGGNVPLSATLVGEGRDEELTYRATRDGVIYVYDADDNRIIGSAGIRDGERFTLMPGRNRATVDRNEVSVGELNTRRNYRVYFDRE